MKFIFKRPIDFILDGPECGQTIGAVRGTCISTSLAILMPILYFPSTHVLHALCPPYKPFKIDQTYQGFRLNLLRSSQQILLYF